MSQGELAVGSAAPGIPAPTRKWHVIYGICCSSKFKMFTALLMFYPLQNKNIFQQTECWAVANFIKYLLVAYREKNK